MANTTGSISTFLKASARASERIDRSQELERFVTSLVAANAQTIANKLPELAERVSRVVADQQDSARTKAAANAARARRGEPPILWSTDVLGSSLNATLTAKLDARLRHIERELENPTDPQTSFEQLRLRNQLLAAKRLLAPLA